MAKSKAAKKARESGDLPDVVPQPHGGALYRRGVPGNKGGGRPPSELRKEMREVVGDHIDTIRRFAEGRATITLRQACPECGHEPDDLPSIQDEIKAALPTVADRIRAIEMAAKVGFGARVTTEDVKERLAQTLDTIRANLDEQAAEDLITRLERIWR